MQKKYLFVYLILLFSSSKVFAQEELCYDIVKREWTVSCPEFLSIVDSSKNFTFIFNRVERCVRAINQQNVIVWESDPWIRGADDLEFGLKWSNRPYPKYRNHIIAIGLSYDRNIKDLEILYLLFEGGQVVHLRRDNGNFLYVEEG